MPVFNFSMGRVKLRGKRTKNTSPTIMHKIEKNAVDKIAFLPNFSASRPFGIGSSHI
ncbi:MAG: hypothetical protein ACLUKN_15195 [Bacilli bacterium]